MLQCLGPLPENYLSTLWRKVCLLSLRLLLGTRDTVDKKRIASCHSNAAGSWCKMLCNNIQTSVLRSFLCYDSMVLLVLFVGHHFFAGQLFSVIPWYPFLNEHGSNT